MKFLTKLLMAMCAAVTATAAVPEYIRNPFTTNTPATASNVVIGIATTVASTNRSIIFAPNVTDAITDANNATNTIKGQPVVSFGGAHGDEPYLWWTKAIGHGMSNLGQVMHLPGGINDIGSEIATPTNSNPLNFHWYLNGNPLTATYSNIAQAGGANADSVWYFHQVNPFAAGLICFPMYTTNSSRAVGAALMTNSQGKPVYPMDDFGFTLGSINPEWPPGITNQAGMMGIILGSAGMANPFHIAMNANPGNSGGVTAQHSVLTLDRRGITNGSMPLVIGFPLYRADMWEPTQSNWAWLLSADIQNGYVDTTNGVLRTSNVMARATNIGAYVFGFNADPKALFNISGSLNINDNSTFSTYTNVFVFDGAETHRFGMSMRGAGQFPTMAHGSTAPWTVSRSSASDLLYSAPTQTFTEELLVDTTGGFTVKGSQTNKFGLHVEQATGSALSPFVVYNTNKTAQIWVRSNQANGSVDFAIGTNITTATVISNWNGNTYLISSNNAPAITIVGANGNVGIGKAAPTVPLDVVGQISSSSIVLGGSYLRTGGFMGIGSVFDFSSGGSAGKTRLTRDSAGAGAMQLMFEASTAAGPNLANTNGHFAIMGGDGLFAGGNTNGLWLMGGGLIQDFTVTAPSSPARQGAVYWNDGTNVCVVLRNSAGTLTTNKITMSSWP